MKMPVLFIHGSGEGAYAEDKQLAASLQQALGPELTPLAKIRLADIVRVQRGLSAQRRSAAFNRISSKHADFVLCDSKTFRVVGVIELDDKSHREETRQRRDQFFDAALAAASLQFWHPFNVTVVDLGAHSSAIMLVTGIIVLTARRQFAPAVR